MSFEAHCPRCGATLPQEDEVLCPGCGNAIGNRTVAIEVSPEELIAEAARRSSGKLAAIGERPAADSAVDTTLSGLLQTEPGAEAVERQSEETTRWGPLALLAGVAAVLVAVACWLAFAR